MKYTIQKLGNLAGVTVRTLHYYDEIGLLKPALVKNNGYRYYEEAELLKLQQILFFRELEFPLAEIKKIIDSPDFDMAGALKDHKKMIELKQKRLTEITTTINKTINKINKKTNMKDDELYKGLDKEEMELYAKEVKERWGNTEAYRQSKERTKNWTKEDYAKIKEDGDKWMKNFALQMHHGAESKIIQDLIAEHYNSLRTFYEPNLEMYRGLGEMYVNDPRFKAFYEKYAIGLAEFTRDAIRIYCDNQK